MNMIGWVGGPTSGSCVLAGVEVTSLKRDQLADLRGKKLGFIFQGFNLLARMNALENVMLPMVYGGVPAQIRQQRGKVALEAVGLTSHIHHRPMGLSGGHHQR